MTKCKHYAVIPSAFNWWGTWLAKNNDKIVVRPKLNFFRFLNIKNKDYWPEDWISLSSNGRKKKLFSFFKSITLSISIKSFSFDINPL